MVSPLAALAEDGMGAVRSNASPAVAYGAQSRGLGMVDSNSSQVGRDGAEELPGAIVVTKTNMDQRHATSVGSALRVVPGVLVWRLDVLPANAAPWVVAVTLVASALGFARRDAKTGDHLFTGFPSYWNIVAVYLIAFRPPPAIAAAILLVLAALVFVPIRYVYPSRTVFLRPLTVALGAAWTVAFVAVIWRLPDPPAWLLWGSLAYPAYYLALSLWLTAQR
jgi:hypothetical protein